MKYRHIARYMVETPWAILQSKLDEIEAILEFHMAGGKFSAEELRARIGDGSARPETGRTGAVAVIPIQGVIAHRMGSMQEMSGGVSTERVAGMIRQALADPSVSSILLDVNSPGGTVSGVTELAAEIRAAAQQKPVTAHVNALAASAAYWAISGATEIVVTPSGEVGSIGVITSHVDTSKAEEADGITRTVISAGKFKAEGAGPLTEDAKAAIQARVDEAYAMMTSDIAKGRGVPVADVRSGFGEGRVVSAKEAVKMGMADKIATFDETVRSMTGRRSQAAMRAEAAALGVTVTDALLSDPAAFDSVMASVRSYRETAARRLRII